jgi:hypothetical protein
MHVVNWDELVHLLTIESRLLLHAKVALCDSQNSIKSYHKSETWSLTLREEHRLRVFENRVLRRIFGPKRDEVTGEWRKLHNEELHYLYSSPDIIRQVKWRRMGWAGHVARVGEERKVYKVLVGKPEGKRPLGRPRRRWEDGIRMYLREIGLGGVDWIRLSQDRDQWRAVVSAVMNLRVLAPRSECVWCRNNQLVSSVNIILYCGIPLCWVS